MPFIPHPKPKSTERRYFKVRHDLANGEGYFSTGTILSTSQELPLGTGRFDDGEGNFVYLTRSQIGVFLMEVHKKDLPPPPEKKEEKEELQIVKLVEKKPSPKKGKSCLL